MDCEATKHNLLERMLLDASAEPTDLPLSLLKEITNNFSYNQQVGRGGFAVVYKGLLPNGTVAVKKLSQILDVVEKSFHREVECLMRVKHKNIVRFLGYCGDTQVKMCNYEGKLVMADVRERLLCFEFVSNGSLDGYIADASRGLKWSTRYQLIKGICEGLHYLHQKNIVHLDLKPANVLLDYNMEPKIADFGLSRCFDENQSHALTSNLVGSLGYLAPEFFRGEMRSELDIYSLGVIIIEILRGQKGYFEIEDVLKSWSNRFRASQGDIRLEQVRVCAEIGLQCIENDQRKRPTTQYIVEKLGMESRCGSALTAICTTPRAHNPNAGVKSLGVTNNSATDMPIEQNPNAQQPPPKKYVKIWEGTLNEARSGLPVWICKLEAYRRGTAAETLAADWPETLEILRLIDKEHAKRYNCNRAEFLVFRALNQYGFLGQLKENRLCALIRLPSQALLLEASDKMGRVIGLLIPGDMVVWEPPVSDHQPTMQQQLQLEQQLLQQLQEELQRQQMQHMDMHLLLQQPQMQHHHQQPLVDDAMEDFVRGSGARQPWVRLPFPSSKHLVSKPMRVEMSPGTASLV